MWVRRPTQFEHRGCGGSFSFYKDVIERHWAGGADETAAAPIHRLCTLARKMHVRSVVIEDAHDYPDVKAEIAHLEVWSAAIKGEVTALAISFLTASKSRVNRAVFTATADDLIGQAVLLTFPTEGGSRTFVFEAIFRLPRSGRQPSAPLLNNYVPIAREFEVCVGGTQLCITGSAFHQQNGVTSLCVHSVVRSLVRNVGGIAATTEQLNALWGYKGGRHQVNTVMACNAFSHYGLRAIRYDLTDRFAMGLSAGLSADDVTWQTVACLAESSTAIVLDLERVGSSHHVIAVVGFTLNTDEWLPHAAPAYLPGRPNEESSSAWVDHLVVHDDLLGPYYCLSRADFFEKKTNHKATLTPKTAIALLPSGVEVSPVEADRTARSAFLVLVDGLAPLEGRVWTGGGWWARLAHSSCRRVWRTTLVTRESYIARLRAKRLISPRRLAGTTILDLYESKIPPRFWLAEVTLPQLYVGNRAGLGEVLIKVEATPDNHMEAVAGFRFPGVVGWANEEDRTFVIGAVSMRRHSPLHAPLYHLNGW